MSEEDQEAFVRWVRRLLILAKECRDNSDDKVLFLLGYIESANTFLEETSE
jgi:hypothetical protein